MKSCLNKIAAVSLFYWITAACLWQKFVLFVFFFSPTEAISDGYDESNRLENNSHLESTQTRDIRKFNFEHRNSVGTT